MKQSPLSIVTGTLQLYIFCDVPHLLHILQSFVNVSQMSCREQGVFLMSASL